MKITNCTQIDHCTPAKIAGVQWVEKEIKV